jgi:hypothetical protein
MCLQCILGSHPTPIILPHFPSPTCVSLKTGHLVGLVVLWVLSFLSSLYILDMNLVSDKQLAKNSPSRHSGNCVLCWAETNFPT